MDEEILAERFERARPRLRAVAHRMLGSAAEADDAVQEAWLRLGRTDAGGLGNLDAWLTTVVGRICLDMLRSRSHRREDPLEPRDLPQDSADPEREAVLADSVGLALLVVLETLRPAERLAFVLHDMFAVSFEEIAPILDRSPAATRQLASRARRRVRAGGAEPEPDVARQKQVVDAFLAAARGGDFAALLAVLDPDVVVRGDAAAARAGGSDELRGADAVARFFIGRARGGRPALIDGWVGLAVPVGGDIRLLVEMTIVEGRIVAFYAVADPDGVRDHDVALLG